jgi:hypothetical protein
VILALSDLAEAKASMPYHETPEAAIEEWKARKHDRLAGEESHG